MRIALFRALGFAFPTVSLVTTSHLLRDASVGEAIDGLVTGLWFVALFLAGSWLSMRLRRSEPAYGSSRGSREIRAGLVAGLASWGLIWLGWSLPLTEPLTEPLRAQRLLINSVVMVVAALATTVARRPLGRPAIA